MKKEFSAGLLLIVCVMLGACLADYDPETALRIEYETPLGCDEVSGTITLRASIRGEGAFTPPAMRYELRTREDGVPVVLTGAAPEYTADFDTTALRDGLVYYRAFPVDGNGKEIDIQSPRYGAVFSPPHFRGLMVNNRTLDMSKPLIVFGAETDPYVDFDKDGYRPGIFFLLQLDCHAGMNMI